MIAYSCWLAFLAGSKERLHSQKNTNVDLRGASFCSVRKREVFTHILEGKHHLAVEKEEVFIHIPNERLD